MAEWLARSAFHAAVDPARRRYSIVIPPPNVTGLAPHGARPQRHHPGHPHPLPPPAGQQHPVGGRHRPRRHRHRRTRWRAQLAGEGLRKDRSGPRGVREARVGLARRVRVDHHPPAQAAGLRLRLRVASASPWTRPTRRPCSRSSSHLYEKGDIYRDVYLVNWCTALRLGHLGPRGGARGARRQAVLRQVPGGRLRRVPDRGHHPPRDDPGRHRRGGQPQGPALRPSYVGHVALVPLAGREVPIIADEHVDIEFGTGALKITPATTPTTGRSACGTTCPASRSSASTGA